MNILDFMPFFYLVPMLAWFSFVSTQYLKGDRPTDLGWLALTTGLGTFECAKGLFSLWPWIPALPFAVLAATLLVTVNLVRVGSLDY